MFLLDDVKKPITGQVMYQPEDTEKIVLTREQMLFLIVRSQKVKAISRGNCANKYRFRHSFPDDNVSSCHFPIC